MLLEACGLGSTEYDGWRMGQQQHFRPGRSFTDAALIPRATSRIVTKIDSMLQGSRRNAYDSPVRKVVGVIGGMGPLATEAFYGELVRATAAASDQEHLHIIIDADATIPSRSDFICGSGPDPRPQIIAAGQRLRIAGCELLAMPCNAAHAFASEVEAAVGIPLVDWIDTAVEAVSSLHATKVGVLGADATRRVGRYRLALGARDMLAVEPKDDEEAEIMSVIRDVKAGRHDSRTAARLIAVGQCLVERGAQALILGCTELPLAVASTDERWPVPTIDPARAVAREIVRRAGAPLATN